MSARNLHSFGVQSTVGYYGERERERSSHEVRYDWLRQQFGTKHITKGGRSYVEYHGQLKLPQFWI